MKTLIVYFNLDGFAVQLKNHLEAALDELQIEWKEAYYQDLEEASNTFQPTMHIFFHPNNAIYDYLPVIKQVKGHKLLWDMESPYESDLVFDLLPYCYYIFTSDKNTAEALKKESTANHIQYVPHSCNPKVHKPMNVSWEYKSDVLFVGNAYESRLAYLGQHLSKYRNMLFRLVGVGYRGLHDLTDHHIIHGHISEEEMVKHSNGAKLVLNLHRQNTDLDMANKRGITPMHLNNRFYELAAMGKQQLIVGRDEMKEEIEKVSQMKPEEYSYVARLKEFYLPLLK